MKAAFTRIRKSLMLSSFLGLGVLAACGGGGGGSTSLLLSDGSGSGGTVPGGTVGPGAATVQFGSDRFDGATATAVDFGGNLYVAGNTWGTVDAANPNPDPTATTSDVFIAKYSRSGILQWIRQVGTPFNDFATAVAIDGSGNAVVVGFTFGDLFSPNADTSHLTSDFFVYKVDPVGAELARLQEGTPDIDEAWGVTTDRSGNIYLGGGTRGNLLGTVNAGDFDGFVASYTDNGALRWGGARKVGPIALFAQFDIALLNRDSARALAYDDARGLLYVAGDFFVPNELLNVLRAVGIFLEKLDPATGAQVPWNAVNENPVVFLRTGEDDAPQLDFATGIAVDREGSIYVSGYEVASDNASSSNAGDSSHLVFKVDSSGNLLWHTYVFGGPSGDRDVHPGAQARGLVIDSMKDVYLSGYTSVALDNNAHLGGTDAFIMQFDGDTGATLWTRQFGTSGNDRAFGIAIDRDRPDTTLYVVGETDGSLDGAANRGGYDAFVAQYDMLGNRR